MGGATQFGSFTSIKYGPGTETGKASGEVHESATSLLTVNRTGPGAFQLSVKTGPPTTTLILPALLGAMLGVISSVGLGVILPDAIV